jgi:hypothetical protein
VSRREFLQVSASAVGGGLLTPSSAILGAGATVALVVAREDRIAAEPQVRWALRELRHALESRGAIVTQVGTVEAAPTAHLAVVVAGSQTPIAAATLERAGVQVPRAPESLALVSGAREGRLVLLSGGHDARGLMYAVLELADRVLHADDPLSALNQPTPVVEQPLNAIRAIGRPFVSDVEDRAWFSDREFWPAYFGMLARQRFNRFHLALGFGYDTLRWVTDAYLLFPYPFLVAPPGHDVKAVNLPDQERDGCAVGVAQSAHRAEDEHVRPRDLVRVPAHAGVLGHAEQMSARLVEEHGCCQGQPAGRPVRLRPGRTHEITAGVEDGRYRHRASRVRG